MQYYSYNNNYPKELPNRIILSDGSSRTDRSTFTEEEIADAGYIRVQNPPLVSENETLSWDGVNWVVNSFTEEQAEQAEQAEQVEQEDLSEAWKNVLALREGMFREVDGLIMRYHSEVRLGLEPTIDISELDTYAQALRDLTDQEDPFNIIWPSSDSIPGTTAS